MSTHFPSRATAPARKIYGVNVMIRIFKTTGDAYDATQTGYARPNRPVYTGTVLVVFSEQVVGWADTWPVAVTKEHGKLHAAVSPLELGYYADSLGSARAEQGLRRAWRVARRLGWMEPYRPRPSILQMPD